MERKSEHGRGRPTTGHIKVQFNIRPEINRMIDLGAAKQEITRSQYIENLVEAALEVEPAFARKILKSWGT